MPEKPYPDGLTRDSFQGLQQGELLVKRKPEPPPSGGSRLTNIASGIPMGIPPDYPVEAILKWQRDAKKGKPVPG
jgi:hypothetical protein